MAIVKQQESGSLLIEEKEVNSVLMSGSIPHKLEHITYIGNNDKDLLWKITRKSAVQRIDGKKEKFYTLFKDKKAYLEVVRPTNELAYVKTQRDDTSEDNLLSLPECSPECVDKSAEDVLP